MNGNACAAGVETANDRGADTAGSAGYQRDFRRIIVSHFHGTLELVEITRHRWFRSRTCVRYNRVSAGNAILLNAPCPSPSPTLPH